MTKLYLRSTTANLDDIPWTRKSAAWPNGTLDSSSANERDLSTTPGSSQASNADTHTANQTHYDREVGRWGFPLGTGVASISAQTWTFAFAGVESNAAANVQAGFSLYVWRPTGAGTGSVIGYILDNHTALMTEYDTAEEGRVGGWSGAEVSGIQDGDMLILEVWVHWQHTMNVAYTDTFYWDGATDPVDQTATSDAASYISSQQDLELSGPGSSSPVAAVAAVPTPTLTGWSSAGPFVLEATIDAYVRSESATYATAQRGTGTLTGFTAQAIVAVGQQYVDPNYYVYETFLEFDATGLPEGTAIDTATLSVFVALNPTFYEFIARARLFDFGTFAASDFRSGDSADTDSLDEYPLLATLDTTGITQDAWNDFTDVALADNINMSGPTRIVLSSSRQESGTAPESGLQERIELSTLEDTPSDPAQLIVYLVLSSPDASVTPATVVATVSSPIPTPPVTAGAAHTPTTVAAVVSSPIPTPVLAIHAPITAGNVPAQAFIDTPTISTSAILTVGGTQAQAFIDTPPVVANASVTAGDVLVQVFVDAPPTSAGASVVAGNVPAQTFIDTPPVVGNAVISAVGDVQAQAFVDTPPLTVGASVVAGDVLVQTFVDLPVVTTAGDANVVAGDVQALSFVDTPSVATGVSVTSGDVQAQTFIPAPTVQGNANRAYGRWNEAYQGVLGTTTVPTPVVTSDSIYITTRAVSAFAANFNYYGMFSVKIQTWPIVPQPVSAGVRIRPPADFSPDDLPELAAWYDYADAATMFKDLNKTIPVAEDGDLVAAIADKSGHGHDLKNIGPVFGETHRPWYKKNIRNGRDATRWGKPAEARLDNDDGLILDETQDFAIFSAIDISEGCQFQLWLTRTWRPGELPVDPTVSSGANTQFYGWDDDWLFISSADYPAAGYRPPNFSFYHDTPFLYTEAYATNQMDDFGWTVVGVVKRNGLLSIYINGKRWAGRGNIYELWTERPFKSGGTYQGSGNGYQFTNNYSNVHGEIDDLGDVVLFQGSLTDEKIANITRFLLHKWDVGGDIPTPLVTSDTVGLVPNTVVAAAQIPTPTISAGSSVTAGNVPAQSFVDLPTVTVTGDALVTAGDVQSSAFIDTPTLRMHAPITAGGVPSQAFIDIPPVSAGAAVTAGNVLGQVFIDTPIVVTDAEITAGDVPGQAFIDSPTTEADASVTPATVIPDTVTVLIPVVVGSSSTTPAYVEALTFIPQPVVDAGGEVFITTDTVVAQAFIDTPQVVGSSSVTPSWVPASTEIPTPAIAVGQSLTAGDILATAWVQSPTVTAGGNVALTTPIIPDEAVVPIPVVTGGSAVTAGDVPASTVVPTPIAEMSVSITPTEIQAQTFVPTSVVTAGASVIAGDVPAVTTIPSPVVSAGGAAYITLDVVPATTTIETPVISVSVSVTFGDVVAFTSVPTPTILVGTGAAIETSTVVAVTAVEVPVVSADANVTPASVIASAAISDPLVSIHAPVSLATVEGIATVPTPSFTSDALILLLAVECQAFIPDVDVSAPGTVIRFNASHEPKFSFSASYDPEAVGFNASESGPMRLT